MSGNRAPSRANFPFPFWGKTLLLALACCLTIVTSGCGKGTTVSANETTGTPQTSPQLTVSAASVAFGNVTMNTAATQSLTLTSTGTAPVTVNSASITGAFTIIQTFPVILNPSQSLTLQVQFAPTTAGVLTGQLTITSTSTTGSPAVVALSGTGTTSSAPQTTPQLTVSATSLSFGSVALNTPVTQSLTLTSTGTSPVTVNSATLTGAGFNSLRASPSF